MSKSNRPAEQTAEDQTQQSGWLRTRLMYLLNPLSPAPVKKSLSPETEQLFSRSYATPAEDIDRFKQVLSADPELAEILEKLVSPEADTQAVFDTVSKLNDRYAPKEERHGKYSQISFRLPSGASLGIKLWEDMKNAMSFSAGARN